MSILVKWGRERSVLPLLSPALTDVSASSILRHAFPCPAPVLDLRHRLHFPLPAPSTTLAQLRHEIAEYTQLPEQSFKLIHAGAVMKDDNAPSTSPSSRSHTLPPSFRPNVSSVHRSAIFAALLFSFSSTCARPPIGPASALPSTPSCCAFRPLPSPPHHRTLSFLPLPPHVTRPRPDVIHSLCLWHQGRQHNSPHRRR